MTESSDAMRVAIRAAAAERARLHAARRAGEPVSEADYAATRAFIDRATSPAALASLQSGGRDALEYGVCFLEVYPFCPDSGFAARDLARALRTAPLSREHEARLRAAFLHIAAGPSRDESRHLRPLLLRVADESLLAALDEMAESAPEDSARGHARALADYLVRKWAEQGD